MPPPRSTPFHWWGPPWAHGSPLSLDDLVRLGSVRAGEATFLRSHVRDGGSVVVAAMPQGAGKSTFAHALADVTAPERTKIYLRGALEPFDWQEQHPADATTLLVNEISDHLPVYCWGDCARRLLALAGAGYQVIGTIHADSPEEFVRLLTGPLLSCAPADVVALDVVVFLDAVVTPAGFRRRVRSIFRLGLGAAGSPVAHPIEIDS